MKTQNNNRIIQAGIFMFLIALGAWVSSCDTPETVSDFSAEDSESVVQESEEDAPIEDTDDLGLQTLSSHQDAGGRVESDSRFRCATITRNGNKAEGSLVVDFGEGCQDAQGRTRRGKLLIEYRGRWSVAGSSWRLRFQDFYFNGVGIQGTRTVTNISTDSLNLAFDVVLEDGQASYPDGSIARRRLHHIRKHERDGNNVLDRLIVYGTAEGNNRSGRGYTIEIIEPLVYNRRCADEGVFIAVQGKKLVKSGDRELTIDYGDGRCDNTVTLINKNGRTKEYTVKQ